MRHGVEKPSEAWKRPLEIVLVGGGSRFFRRVRESWRDGMSNGEDEGAHKVINRVSGTEHEAFEVQ